MTNKVVVHQRNATCDLISGSWLNVAMKVSSADVPVLFLHHNGHTTELKINVDFQEENLDVFRDVDSQIYRMMNRHYLPLN